MIDNAFPAGVQFQSALIHQTLDILRIMQYLNAFQSVLLLENLITDRTGEDQCPATRFQNHLLVGSNCLLCRRSLAGQHQRSAATNSSIPVCKYIVHRSRLENFLHGLYDSRRKMCHTSGKIHHLGSGSHHGLRNPSIERTGNCGSRLARLQIRIIVYQ